MGSFVFQRKRMGWAGKANIQILEGRNLLVMTMPQ